MKVLVITILVEGIQTLRGKT